MFGPGPGAILYFSVLQPQVHLQERAAAELNEFLKHLSLFKMVKIRETQT